jgi:hypothetical protein
MKNVRNGIYLFVMLLISCASLAAGSYKVVHVHDLFSNTSSIIENDLNLDLPAPESNIYHRLTHFEDKEFSFNTRFHKKQKTKFLIQHLNFSHYIRKPDRLFLLQDVHLIQEFHTDHPADNWLIRPAYYTFLFRLSPF